MAVRISGVVIPQEKRIEIGLTYVYGIGKTRAVKILQELKIDPNIRVKNLSESDSGKLNDFIKKTYRVEGDLKREVMGNIKRLKDIKSYRGSRHAKRLPTRGQRTKTNSRTVRGNVRLTMGSGKVKISKT